MGTLFSRSSLFVKRNGGTILTCIAGLGVIGTAITAVTATPKAMRLLEVAEGEKGEELTNMEIVQVAGPVYIPTVLIGAGTLACMFGANVLNKRQQAALISAYALLDSSYKEHKAKVEELYGPEANRKVREEIAKDNYDEEDVKTIDGEQLFYDMYSNRYFESTIETVQRAEYRINRHLVMRDYAYLNEFYEEVGLPPIDSGYEIGWSTGANMDRYWQSWIDFTHEKITMEDGLECYIITMQSEPYADFADYF